MKVHFKLFIILLASCFMVHAYCVDHKAELKTIEESLRIQLQNYHPLKSYAVTKLGAAVLDIIKNVSFQKFHELTADIKGNKKTRRVLRSVYNYLVYKLVSHGDVYLLKELLNYAEKDNMIDHILNDHYEGDRKTILHVAVEKGNLPIVQLLTSYEELDYTQADIRERSAKHLAFHTHFNKAIDLEQWLNKKVSQHKGFRVRNAKDIDALLLSESLQSHYFQEKMNIASAKAILDLITAKELASLRKCSESFRLKLVSERGR